MDFFILIFNNTPVPIMPITQTKFASCNSYQFLVTAQFSPVTLDIHWFSAAKFITVIEQLSHSSVNVFSVY